MITSTKVARPKNNLVTQFGYGSLSRQCGQAGGKRRQHQVPAKVMTDFLADPYLKIGHDFCRHLVTVRVSTLAL